MPSWRSSGGCTWSEGSTQCWVADDGCLHCSLHGSMRKVSSRLYWITKLKQPINTPIGGTGASKLSSRSTCAGHRAAQRCSRSPPWWL